MHCRKMERISQLSRVVHVEMSTYTFHKKAAEK